MRGKVPFSVFHGFGAGITPACAGKSLYALPTTWAGRDHPRVCGEKSVWTHLQVEAQGSPPRVRGKDFFYSRMPPRMGDHPRVCGEKFQNLHHDVNRLGSPPRVRGKVNRFTKQGATVRITPACAGKRLKRSHSIGHFSCILCLFHSVLHRASVSGGSRAGPCAPPCLPAQNAVPV